MSASRSQRIDRAGLILWLSTLKQVTLIADGHKSILTTAAPTVSALLAQQHLTVSPLDRLNAEGCARYVVTDVLKDGTLRGPNLGLLRDVCARTTAPVVASGGVSSLADLRAIASLVPAGVEGAIVGTALYEGAFTLEEALAEVAVR